MPAMIVDAFCLLKQESRMSNAHTTIGSMTGFIVCTAILFDGIDTEDDELRNLTEHQVGMMDVVINISSISHISEAEDKCSIVLNNGSLIFVKEDLDAIIQKIRRATALVHIA
jgi:uncharacterized protein YlzI (FlbEa/FlbD family)